MTERRGSIFREGLQVSPETVKNFRDSDLNEIMGELLLAQAHRCGADVSQVVVNTEGAAPDEGSDGRTPAPPSNDPWLGDAETCWQFKAGRNGEPAKLKGEVKKDSPKNTLKRGGRFVVIASSSTAGDKGEKARLKILRDEAEANGIPSEKIDVLGSERLTTWCNQHPAIAAYKAAKPEGLWTLKDWIATPVHKLSWYPTPKTTEDIKRLRLRIDYISGQDTHVHIRGKAGVGKTRFALELCRDAVWSRSVVYFDQATDPRLIALIDRAAVEEGIGLTVVADEVETKQLERLNNSIQRGNGRLRLVTIGDCPTPDSSRIPIVEVERLDKQTMASVVKGWQPELPLEHVDFIVRFADGFIKLGYLAANAVAADHSIDVEGLLAQEDIRAFMDRMLGEGDRTCLYVVAVLARVGWKDEIQGVGRAIADHLGLEWTEVKTGVETFHRRFGIVPRGGRYRYISPAPLGVYLAREAWEIFEDELRTLPDKLPSDEACKAYYERLEMMAGSPQARNVARDGQRFFFNVASFYDSQAVRRWTAFSGADPELAAKAAYTALAGASHDQCLRIAEGARRELVWGLVRLAWHRRAFRYATMALAHLAEAENETWANNATAEFIGKFRVYLGGTAVPYPDRLAVLDEVLGYDGEGYARLVIKALSRVGSQQEARMSPEPTSGELPEPEWHPRDAEERLSCVQLALERLVQLARGERPVPSDALVDAAKELDMLLRQDLVRQQVADFYVAVRYRYPETREALRREVSGLLYREKKYWKALQPDDIAAIEELHSKLEDLSLGGRVRQFVGEATWNREEQIDLTGVAAELAADRDTLAAEWAWLTSGKANGAWRLGEALAAVDPDVGLLEVLVELPYRGRDLRVMCGYLNEQQKRRGEDWLDDWLDRHLTSRPEDIQIVLDATWRCGATPRRASRVASIISSEEAPPELVGQLGYGRWEAGLTRESLVEVMDALNAKPQYRSTALDILEHRLKSQPEEQATWEPFAKEILTSGDLIRSGHMTSYYWKEVALKYVPGYAREIAAAIFREHASRKQGTWFIKHSEAHGVLQACVRADPPGTWQELRPYLETDESAHLFLIGFPEGILEQMPREGVEEWIRADPENRVRLAIRASVKSVASDDMMAARLLGEFGDNDSVASSFFVEYISGSWTGPASEHWNQMADQLEKVARETSFPKLRRWADDAVSKLKEMVEREREREEEEKLRGY